MRIDACFDSHVHWSATGEFATRLRIDGLSTPSDVASIKNIQNFKRGEWLVGQGWDETKWSEKPHRLILDQTFAEMPVAFSRCDGHALWVNTAALVRANLWNQSTSDIAGSPILRDGRILRDAEGWPTGILVDRAMEAVDNLIPRASSMEVRRHLHKANQIFNEAGFTHIRDMTCDETQWSEALKLDESGLLTMAVEEYFWVKAIDALDSVLSLAQKARHRQSANLRVKGIKIFLDGALGSEGAWLSRCYHGSNDSGLKLWEKSALREVLQKTWECGLEPALHAIGDEAAAFLIDVAVELKAEGKSGKFHIEHAELLRPDTIAKMSGLDLQCHIQPAHWLTDHTWLEKKLGDLSHHAFPWRRLQEAEIPFDFGSDAPIEPASLGRTLQALRQSVDAGVPRLLGLPYSHMSHRDLSWAPNSFTLLEEEAPTQVVFRGEHIVSPANNI